MEQPNIPLDERKNFSDRLKTSLRENNISPRPAAFARGFNVRAEGSSVTAHAARKWLVGKAIPTQERILILSRWLNVNAAWLRFGDAENTDFLDGNGFDEHLSEHESVLVKGIIALSKPSQAVVQDLVESLRRLEGALGPQKKRSRE